MVNPKGFHDFFPTSTGFITCDTFGNAEHGMVLNEDGYLRRNFFLENDFAPRGVSGDEQELLVGHSHKGPRSKRFKGNGGIIIFKNGQEPEYFSLPSSQVYQIMREDGAYLMPLENCSHQKIKDKLDRRFGPSVKIGLYSEEDISWNNENE